MHIMIARSVVDGRLQLFENGFGFVPLRRVLSNIAAQDNGVRMAGVDHIHGATQVVSGMRRVLLAQVCITELQSLPVPAQRACTQTVRKVKTVRPSTSGPL